MRVSLSLLVRTVVNLNFKFVCYSSICFRDETVLVSPKSPSKDHPLGNNQAYGITSYDDKKNTSAETRMQENLINE